MKNNEDVPRSDEALIKSDNLFPVVGVGASAGGLDAFTALIKTIPEKSGMAWVFVQHLSADHESLLPEILQRVTAIPVLQIADDVKIAPDHIYIIPRNKMLIANDGKLQLSPRSTEKAGLNLPINLFFSSLAEVHQSHSIGVILSGAGNDGTQGLKAIADCGGITIVQDPATASYASMPQSAIHAGVADFILPPEEIPQKLAEVVSIIAGGESENNRETDHAVIKEILQLLKMRKDTDFTYYKQTTIKRRILRRMALSRYRDTNAYLKFLRTDKNEQDLLFNDFLIPVTTFFRDEKTFEYLCDELFPQLYKDRTAAQPLRVWVAGCSTGEEAYSIAICLKQFLGDNNDKVQIFATDISEKAIAKARAGMYTAAEIENVSSSRLREFFTKTVGGFQLKKEIRNMCVFAVHNFLKDPPFGRIDFISCRNVLIYMEPYLQKKALTTFHYSLNPKGALLLGRSETVSSVPALFSSNVKTEKIFSRKDGPGKFMQVATERREEAMRELRHPVHPEATRTDFQKTADDIMLNRYTPAGVVINAEGEIVHFRGRTTDYLEQPPGKPTANLFKMAKQGLSFELRNLLHKISGSSRTAYKENIAVKTGDDLRMIRIEAVPLPNLVEPHYLMMFHPQTEILSSQASAEPAAISREQDKDLRIQQLEQELIQIREDIRAVTEEQESANEELQSANEELLSGSEELQSLNEELETGKEELQSTNEELIIVNREMIGLNEQLTVARNYAEAIIANIRQPLLVLDKNLRVKSANEAFYKKFFLKEPDVQDCFLYEIGGQEWNIPELRTLLEQILPHHHFIRDHEVAKSFSKAGDLVFLLNAFEIISIYNPEKLILLSFEDVTEAAAAKKQQQAHNHALENAVQERTGELRGAVDTLRNKNIELARMNEDLDEFTYVSSHDLQEPLRKIRTFTNKLLKSETGNLSEDGKHMFTRIESAAERMQLLIQNLLTFARLRTTERKFELINLQTIALNVQKDMEERLAEQQAVLEINADCTTQLVPFQIHQLLFNLISNSLKFARPGIPPLIIINCIKLRGSEANDARLIPDLDYCKLTVSDNGIGFEKEYNERIFEVFEKLHGKEEYAGTGIGLAIVKKIVANHNGFISASGVLDRGATFVIFIPAEIE